VRPQLQAAIEQFLSHANLLALTAPYSRP
jgi:hypothetical protein